DASFSGCLSSGRSVATGAESVQEPVHSAGGRGARPPSVDRALPRVPLLHRFVDQGPEAAFRVSLDSIFARVEGALDRVELALLRLEFPEPRRHLLAPAVRILRLLRRGLLLLARVIVLDPVELVLEI